MKLQNQIYQGVGEKKALYDLLIPDDKISKKLLVFIHGYMGFKDWGAWNLMFDEFYKAGFSCAKLNLTHNGTSIDSPTEFVDLDAFANGGYWKELQDIKLFLNHLESKYSFNEFILVGHSRGGGMAILSGHDDRVKAIHCLAPICDIAKRFPKGDEWKDWLDNKVYYRLNGRTNQQMPHDFIQFEEYWIHRDELNIEHKARQLQVPVFVYHGENDESIMLNEGENIAKWSDGKLFVIKNTNHVFDAVEPWQNDTLPAKLLEVLSIMIPILN